MIRFDINKQIYKQLPEVDDLIQVNFHYVHTDVPKTRKISDFKEVPEHVNKKLYWKFR